MDELSAVLKARGRHPGERYVMDREKLIETLLACELGPAGLFDQRVTLEMVFDEWAAEYAGQSIPCREWAGKLADAILALDAPAQDVILRHNVAKINIGLRLQEIDLSAWRDWKP